MNQYFITGTDTGVGKTLVSAILMLTLKARYWKPIQSGIEDEISDQEKIQSLTHFSDDYFISTKYCLKASLSPDQAAALEGKKIDFSEIEMPSINCPLIIEGAGGLFVPLNSQYLMIDLIKKLNLETIIVARGSLGTINHTLLTIESLRKHNIVIKNVILSGKLNPDNQIAIEKWGKIKSLHIPHFDNINSTVLKEWVLQNNEKILKVFT